MAQQLRRRDFRRFWDGVAGWPKFGRASGWPATSVRYLIGLNRHVPDFAEDEFGLVHLTARAHCTGLHPALSPPGRDAVLQWPNSAETLNIALAILEPSE